MQMTVYHFFLNHSEGITFPYMVDHEAEVLKLYKRYAQNADIATLINRVNSIVKNEDATLSVLISKINTKIKNTIGSEMAKAYLILRTRDEPHKIIFNRDLLTIKEPKFTRKL